MRVSGYTDPAVEGTTVTFHYPPRLVLDGPNSSMCMENGEWEPALSGKDCSGTNMISSPHQFTIIILCCLGGGEGLSDNYD